MILDYAVVSESHDHGTNMRGKLENRCARLEQYLLFDLFKAFDWIKRDHKSILFSPKRPIFLRAFAACSELPSNLSTMVMMRQRQHVVASPKRIVIKRKENNKNIFAFIV